MASEQAEPPNHITINSSHVDSKRFIEVLIRATCNKRSDS